MENQDLLWSMKYNFDFEPKVILNIGKPNQEWMDMAIQVWPLSEIFVIPFDQTNQFNFYPSPDLVRIDDEHPKTILNLLNKTLTSTKYLLVKVDNVPEGWTFVKPTCFINTIYLVSLYKSFRFDANVKEKDTPILRTLQHV